MVKMKNQIREWCLGILTLHKVGTEAEIRAFLHSPYYEGFLEGLLGIEGENLSWCICESDFEEYYGELLKGAFQKWLAKRNVWMSLSEQRTEPQEVDSLALLIANTPIPPEQALLTGYEGVFRIPLEWLTPHEQESLTRYAKHLSKLYFYIRRSMLYEILGHKPHLTPEQCEQIAHQWESDGCVRALRYNLEDWWALWEQVSEDPQRRLAGAYISFIQGRRSPLYFGNWMGGIYLKTSESEGYFCSHLQGWDYDSRPCPAHPDESCSYSKVWKLLRSTAIELQFWTPYEVCCLLLRGFVLPPCAGWCEVRYPDNATPRSASITLFLNPCLSAHTARRIYAKANAFLNRVDAQTLALYQFACEAVYRVEKHPPHFAHLLELWNFLAPEAWQYNGERRVEVFRRALRRAIEQVDALIARPSYESPIRNLPPLRKRAE